MVGHVFDGGALRLTGTYNGEHIDWTNDTFNIALMGPTYVQNRLTQAEDAVNGQEHWSDVVAYEVTPTGNYVTGGQALTTVAPYIEATLYAPFRYTVLTANAGSSPAYSCNWTQQTFTAIPGAVVYKVGGTTATSPLLTYLDLTGAGVQTTVNETYYVGFGALGASLGIVNQQIF